MYYCTGFSIYFYFITKLWFILHINITVSDNTNLFKTTPFVATWCLKLRKGFIFNKAACIHYRPFIVNMNTQTLTK